MPNEVAKPGKDEIIEPAQTGRNGSKFGGYAQGGMVSGKLQRGIEAFARYVAILAGVMRLVLLAAFPLISLVVVRLMY